MVQSRETLQPGQIYIGKKDFSNDSKSLHVGQRVRYLRSGYIPYDREHIHQFEDCITKLPVELWFLDTMPLNAWIEYLESSGQGDEEA
jgi:hypothetical protein